MTETNERSSEEKETGDDPWRDSMLVHHLWRIAFEHHKRLTGHADPASHSDCTECYQFLKMAEIINERKES